MKRLQLKKSACHLRAGFGVVQGLIGLVILAIAVLAMTQFMTSLSKQQGHVKLSGQRSIDEAAILTLLGDPISCTNALQTSAGTAATFVPGGESTDFAKIVVNGQTIAQLNTPHDGLIPILLRLKDFGPGPVPYGTVPGQSKYLATLEIQLAKENPQGSSGPAALKPTTYYLSVITDPANKIVTCAANDADPASVCLSLGGSWLPPRCDFEPTTQGPNPLGTVTTSTAPLYTPTVAGPFTAKQIALKGCFAWSSGSYDHCICPVNTVMTGFNADRPRPPGMIFQATCQCCYLETTP